MIRRTHAIYALALPISWASLLGFEGLVLGAVIVGLWAIVFYSNSRPKALGTLVGLAFIGSCLFGLFTPAVGRGVPSRATRCMNNLRNIGLALRAYHVAHGSFPPAYIADENGEPLLSWRVLLLPYLDSAALYRKFDLTKPWDSPENLKLAKVELPFYSCPSHRSRKRESMTTSYLAVTGPHAAWPGSTTMESSGLKDGEANTILVIEHHSDVVWTEPRDLTLEEAAQALASTDPDNFEGHGRETLFEEIYDQGRNVAFADGRVTLVAPALDRTLATELLTIDDGKPADDWYRQMERSVSIRQAKWRNVILFWTCVGLSVLPLPWVWIHPHGSQTQATVNPSAPDTQLPGERGA